MTHRGIRTHSFLIIMLIYYNCAKTIKVKYSNQFYLGMLSTSFSTHLVLKWWNCQTRLTPTSSSTRWSRITWTPTIFIVLTRKRLDEVNIKNNSTKIITTTNTGNGKTVLFESTVLEVPRFEIRPGTKINYYDINVTQKIF